jgi:sucrose-6F-phosphate phosphohydrolase
VGTQIELFAPPAPLAGWCEPAPANWSVRRIRAALAHLSDLVPQPEEFHSSHKVSFYTRAASTRLLDRVRDLLVSNQVSAHVVYSSQRDLDILPQGVHKGSAVQFLADYWQLSPRQVIVCGDSGNDRSMFEQGFYGVVVGNAQLELRRLKGPCVYHARRGFAAGVLQGLGYWLTGVPGIEVPVEAGAWD